mmetsp:Transcript_2577/g.5651  ORF Transcript_2577/g.5651 Transcript_2577/m.5651 type:complete len:340 (-) Transcript_2577:275-1294(-)
MDCGDFSLVLQHLVLGPLEAVRRLVQVRPQRDEVYRHVPPRLVCHHLRVGPNEAVLRLVHFGILAQAVLLLVIYHLIKRAVEAVRGVVNVREGLAVVFAVSRTPPAQFSLVGRDFIVGAVEVPVRRHVHLHDLVVPLRIFIHEIAREHLLVGQHLGIGAYEAVVGLVDPHQRHFRMDSRRLVLRGVVCCHMLIVSFRLLNVRVESILFLFGERIKLGLFVFAVLGFFVFNHFLVGPNEAIFRPKELSLRGLELLLVCHHFIVGAPETVRGLVHIICAIFVGFGTVQSSLLEGPAKLHQVRLLQSNAVRHKLVAAAVKFVEVVDAVDVEGVHEMAQAIIG